MSAGAQAGWYRQPDCTDRYWDGELWTDSVRPGLPLPPTGPPVSPYVQSYAGQPQGQQPLVAPKSPGLALLGSFFLPGLGQLIIGKAGAGVAFFVVWLISFPLMLIYIGFPMAFFTWVWSMVDAYTGSQRWNAQRGIIS